MIKTSMGVHKLEVRKGSRTDIVDHTAPLAANASIPAGSVCHQTAGGVLVAGLNHTDVGKLPLFAWSGTDAQNYPDVQRDRGMPYAGEARFGTITAFAAVELTSTEFDATVNYANGDALTCVRSGVADAGKLRKVALPTDVVVGFVSQGKYESPDGYATLAFYPDYKAGTTVPATLS